jgi:hypothetical protein
MSLAAIRTTAARPRPRLFPLGMIAIALAAACSGDGDVSGRTDANGWLVAFAAPTDTLYLDTASITAVGDGVYRAWFRGTRNPELNLEETDCTRRRTRSIGTANASDRSIVTAEGAWEEVRGGRSGAYLRTLCDIAPRQTP